MNDWEVVAGVSNTALNAPQVEYESPFSFAYTSLPYNLVGKEPSYLSVSPAQALNIT